MTLEFLLKSPALSGRTVILGRLRCVASMITVRSQDDVWFVQINNGLSFRDFCFSFSIRNRFLNAFQQFL